MTGAELYAECREILVDIDGDTYLDGDGLKWVNDAQRTVSLVKPEATSAYMVMQMQAGETRQSLPDGARRLLGVARNMGVTGTSPGPAVRGPVRLESMDSVYPGWHREVGPYVLEYGYNEEVEQTFWVYPAPAVDTHLELIVSAYPQDLTTPTDTIALKDIYIPPMREWVLYCLLARDNELSPNMARANMHFQAFFNLLQVKLQADMRVKPQRVEREYERAS